MRCNIHGCIVSFISDITGNVLRDSEQVPLLEEGGIEAEVLLYVPDAWIDEPKTQIGYEISFTREFYKPVPIRSLEKITADIWALEREAEGSLDEILGKIC